MSTSRKHYSSQEKVNILREHLIGRRPIADICEKYQIHPTLLYRWQKEFFENGASAFEKPSKQTHLDKKVTELEQRLQRKHEVLSELMEEHIQLKKSLGES
jgi:transposase-like protein